MLEGGGGGARAGTAPDHHLEEAAKPNTVYTPLRRHQSYAQTWRSIVFLPLHASDTTVLRNTDSNWRGNPLGIVHPHWSTDIYFITAND